MKTLVVTAAVLYSTLFVHPLTTEPVGFIPRRYKSCNISTTAAETISKSVQENVTVRRSKKLVSTRTKYNKPVFSNYIQNGIQKYYRSEKSNVLNVNMNTFKRVCTVFCLILIIFTPDSLTSKVFCKSNTEQYSRNEMLKGDGKTTYGRIFEIRNVPQRVYVWMVPSFQGSMTNDSGSGTRQNGHISTNSPEIPITEQGAVGGVPSDALTTRKQSQVITNGEPYTSPRYREKAKFDTVNDSVKNRNPFNSYGVSEPVNGFVNHTSPAPNGSTNSNITSPYLSDKAARDETFSTWPRINKPDPSILSDAGFYYIGYEDSVRCFCCGGGCNGFTSDSDPYEVHLRNFPACDYIQQHTKHRPHGNSSVTDRNTTHEKINENETNSSVSRQSERKSTLTYSEIKSLLQIGLQKKQIEDHICFLLSNVLYETSSVSFQNAVTAAFTSCSYGILDGHRRYTTDDEEVTTDSILQTLFSHDTANLTAKVEGHDAPRPSLHQHNNEVANNTAHGQLNGFNASGQMNGHTNHEMENITEKGARTRHDAHQPSLHPHNKEVVNNTVQGQSNGLNVSGQMNGHTDHEQENSTEKGAQTSHTRISSNEHDKESLQSLKEENLTLREQMLCKICLDKSSSVVFLDCGHMVCCPDCSPNIRKCPMCRQLIKGRIQVM